MFDEDNTRVIMNYVQWHSGNLKFLADPIRDYVPKEK